MFACVVLTSCSILKQELPAKKTNSFEQYVWVNDTHSSYGYNQLDEDLKQVYSDIANAWMNFDETVTTEKTDENDVNAVMMSVLRDYPIINWVKDRYTYRHSIGKMTVKFEYTLTDEEAQKHLSELNDKTALLLQDISPDLSDFDKAVLAHDKLVQTITYDRDAPYQDSAYGAVVEGRAACLGYSKAYQMLLLKMGIESIVVFGEANEPHAWNLVMLGDEYYFADVTFDDREISNGGTYLSREYLFLNDNESIKTHTPSGNGLKYPIPACKGTKENYFLKKNLLINTDNGDAFIKKVKEATLQAIENRQEAFQIKVQTAELQKSLNDSVFETGEADSAISFLLSKYNGVSYVGRTFEPESNVNTFLLEYTESSG